MQRKCSRGAKLVLFRRHGGVNQFVFDVIDILKNINDSAPRSPSNRTVQPSLLFLLGSLTIIQPDNELLVLYNMVVTMEWIDMFVFSTFYESLSENTTAPASFARAFFSQQ